MKKVCKDFVNSASNGINSAYLKIDKMGDKSKGTPEFKSIIDPHGWVMNYSDHMYSYAITRVNDEELARDLVQETFLSALEKINQFEGRSSEETWLIAILKNKIFDFYRRKSSKSGRKIGALDEKFDQDDFFDNETGHWKEADQPGLFTKDSHDPIIRKEFLHVLQNCLEKLPVLWFAAFTMKHVEDMPTPLVCSELKLTPSNFWVIMHRAKTNLRACLQKSGL